MAPEQAAGKTRRSGRPPTSTPWARSSTRLLTGRPPFRAATLAGDAGAGHRRRAGAAVAAAAAGAARPGDHLPEVPGEGAGRGGTPRPRAWPRTCGGSGTGSRSRRGRSAAWERAYGGGPTPGRRRPGHRGGRSRSPRRLAAGRWPSSRHRPGADRPDPGDDERPTRRSRSQRKSAAPRLTGAWTTVSRGKTVLGLLWMAEGWRSPRPSRYGRLGGAFQRRTRRLVRESRR